MSGALIDFVEARLDAIHHGVRSDEPVAREPAAPPITPNNPRKTIRSRHAKTSPKITDSLHEEFGWLEEYVDIKLELMKKRDSMASSSSFTNDIVDDSPHGGSHHHRRSLSRRESLGLEIKTSDKSHRRSHSRRESLLIGLEQDKAIVDAALAA